MGSIYDRLEQAGHELTCFAGPSVGISTYYCERCGAVLMLAGETVKVFHAPPGISTVLTRCGDGLVPESSRTTLKVKLDILHDEEMERLRAI